MTEGGGHGKSTAARVNGGGSVVTPPPGTPVFVDVHSRIVAAAAAAAAARKLHGIDWLPHSRLEDGGAIGHGQDDFMRVGVYDARLGGAVTRGAGG